MKKGRRKKESEKLDFQFSLFSVSHFSFSIQKYALICVNLWLFFFAFSSNAWSQSKIAVLVPEKNVLSQSFAEKLETSIAGNFKIINASLSDVAFRAGNYEQPFNLSLAEAKNIGAAIGCNYFLLVKAESLRRYSFEKKEFFESYAAVYAVSSRTGRLVFWKLVNGEAETAEKSEKKLFESVNPLSAEVSDKIKLSAKLETGEKSVLKLEELPAENSPEAKNFRPPLPYRRIKPEYTKIANLYSVEATVDAETEVDENGKILKIEIVRWAGYGLDESVVETINRMQWRAASRDGKNLPIRVLLRYNFKKIEKDE